MLRAAVRDDRAARRRPEAVRLKVPALAGAPVHGPGGVNGYAQGHERLHDHGHSHEHDHSHGAGRGGLVGMGIAGGLVPSPSALLVLLASVALGRTAFGVLLVLAYGLGMATTLTAVGLALVRLRDRLSTRAPSPGLRFAFRWAPVLTAALVLVVGLALVVRSLALGA